MSLFNQSFWKECVKKCLENIKDDKWNNINVMRDIFSIFRDEFKGTMFPYLCLFGIYIVWLLLLMMSNTFLIWYICSNNARILIYSNISN